MPTSSTVFSVLSLFSLFPFIVGYSFDITAAPTQCAPLSLEITGGDGSPPYTALVVPYNSLNGKQRTAFSQQFSDASTSFLVPYPADSDFVIVISDSNGLGTGGTSTPTTVGSSRNDSCLSSNPGPRFSFEFLSGNFHSQCQPITMGWTSDAQGNVSVSLIIPGGQSSEIRTADAISLPGGLIGFSWVPSVRAGTSVLLVVGDSRGPGTGGSTNFTIGDSPTQDTTCLNSQSPTSSGSGASSTVLSSTIGTPAGAGQTDPPGQGGQGGQGGGTSRGGGGRKSNHAGIIAGSVGGVVACVIGGLLALCFVRRRRRLRHPAAHMMDLIPDGAQGEHEHPPEFYQPNPFIVPASHADAEHGGLRAGTERSSMSDVGRRHSTMGIVSGNLLAVGAGGLGTGKNGPGPSQKSRAGMPQLQPVNVVMHEDAGGLPEASKSGQMVETGTIELPPSYNSVRR